MVSTRRDFLNSLSAIIGSSFLLTDSMLAKTIGNKKINYPDILADQYFMKKESSYLNHASIGTVPKVVHAGRFPQFFPPPSHKYSGHDEWWRDGGR